MLRLSALGDVAILEPVVRQRAAQCPDAEFLLAAPPMLQPLFEGIPNLTYIPTKKASSWQLFKQLRKYRPSAVADMHGVWRSWGVRALFLLTGVGGCGIRKERSKRKKLLRETDKDLTPLTPSWRRYDRVLQRVIPELRRQPELSPSSRPAVSPSMIGVAPFAQHKGKIYPQDKMERVVELLSQRGAQVLLFGGKGERSILEAWSQKYPNVESVAGRYSFEEELERISQLDVMLSMDSANMHFASCKGVRVVSVWGATHPAAGFYGYGQNLDDAVQLDLPCRPCSMFGKKPCRYGDYRCLNGISPERIVERVLEP